MKFIGQKSRGVANNIFMAIDSLAVVFGTLVIEYHLLFGVDVPNKSLFHFPEQEFTHLMNILSQSTKTIQPTDEIIMMKPMMKINDDKIYDEIVISKCLKVVGTQNSNLA